MSGYVKLVSAEGHEFFVHRECANVSQTIGAMLSGELRTTPWPKVRLLWLTAEGETIVLDSQRVFDQFAGEEWCVQPWVLHVHEDSPKATHALALHDASRALFERCAISANSGAQIRRAVF